MPEQKIPEAKPGQGVELGRNLYKTAKYLADLKNANSLSKSAKPEDMVQEATKIVVESDNKST